MERLVTARQHRWKGLVACWSRGTGSGVDLSRQLCFIYSLYSITDAVGAQSQKPASKPTTTRSHTLIGREPQTWSISLLYERFIGESARTEIKERGENKMLVAVLDGETNKMALE